MNLEVQNEYKCDCAIIHEDVVEKVRADQHPEEHLIDLADFFKVLGDSTRSHHGCRPRSLEPRIKLHAPPQR